MTNHAVESPITKYLHHKATKLRIPLNGTFELTPVCNMECRMCYVRMTKAQQEAVAPLRTASEWLALGEEARNRGMLYLLLTGGEPFLRPDFFEILEGLHHMGLVISINSNGTLIDEGIVRQLRRTPPTRINMTLYGASDATYNRLCRNPKGFTQAVRAIRLLREAGIEVKLNCSVTPYNAADLPEILRFAKEEKLVIQATSYMFPPLRRDASMVGQNDRFSPEDAAYYGAKIASLLNGEDAFLRRMQENAPQPLPADTGEDCLETEGDGVRCRAGKCSFWVTWDGKMLPCGMLPSHMGKNVFEVGFSEAWTAAMDAIQSIRLPAKCKACASADFCRACAAMVYTESGSFNTAPDYRCKMTYAYPDACRRVEREILQKRLEKEGF